MKLQISIGKEQLQGYTQIDPISQMDKLSHSDIYNLNHVAEPSQCLEILIEDVLDYVGLREVKRTMQHWTSKLRHGGKLVITGIDRYELLRASTFRRMKDEDVVRLMYGEQTHPWNSKKCLYSLSELGDALQELGLKVETKRLNGLNYCVIAVRQ